MNNVDFSNISIDEITVFGERGDICHFSECDKEGKLFCSSCGIGRYCCKEHFHRDYDLHKTICGEVQYFRAKYMKGVSDVRKLYENPKRSIARILASFSFTYNIGDHDLFVENLRPYMNKMVRWLEKLKPKKALSLIIGLFYRVCVRLLVKKEQVISEMRLKSDRAFHELLNEEERNKTKHQQSKKKKNKKKKKKSPKKSTQSNELSQLVNIQPPSPQTNQPHVLKVELNSPDEEEAINILKRDLEKMAKTLIKRKEKEKEEEKRMAHKKRNKKNKEFKKKKKKMKSQRRKEFDENQFIYEPGWIDLPKYNTFQTSSDQNNHKQQLEFKKNNINMGLAPPKKTSQNKNKFGTESLSTDPFPPLSRRKVPQKRKFNPKRKKKGKKKTQQQQQSQNQHQHQEEGGCFGRKKEMYENEIKKLKKKIEELEERISDSQDNMEDILVCPICCENKRNYVLHCGHPFCDLCIENFDKCPVCRKRNLSRTKLYL